MLPSGIQGTYSQSQQDQDGITQCPQCRMAYIKDKEDESVQCNLCGIMFCFRCACLLGPARAHGNHYHRPQCKFYAIYDGKDDKIEKKCTECIRLGVKCMPPKNLRVPQRVDPDEAY